MKRYVGVGNERALDQSERSAATGALASVGARGTSLDAAGSRDVVLRIVPAERARLARLATALGGAGRPAGVASAERDGDDALVVRFDAARTPLGTLVALIDAELGGAPRAIEPLAALADADLTAFAAALLGDPALDPSRLVETHLEPLLGAAR